VPATKKGKKSKKQLKNVMERNIKIGDTLNACSSISNAQYSLQCIKYEGETSPQFDPEGILCIQWLLTRQKLCQSAKVKHTHTPQPQHRSCVSFKVRNEITINGEKVKRKTIVGESWRS